MGLKPLSETVPKVTSKTFQRKFIQLGRILEYWEDIMGKEFADKAQPIKIHYRKAKENKKKVDAVLEIATSSADASVFMYQKEVILMRINHIFGDGWVKDIKFKHITPDIKTSALPRRKKALSPTDQKDLSEILENIADPDIKSRLQSLGEAIMKDRK